MMKRNLMENHAFQGVTYMIKKRIAVIVFLLCFCVHMMSFAVQAETASDHIDKAMTENKCSLTVSYCYGDTQFVDMHVKVYRIADASANLNYTLTQSFESLGLNLNEVQSVSEWNVIRYTLQTYIIANGINPDVVSKTNESGQVYFDSLDTGMYMVLTDQTIQNDFDCLFDSSLISLPGIDQNGKFIYNVLVNAKGEVLPPIDSDEKIEFKVVKLWNDSGRQTIRPKEVEIEIFKDGISYKKTILSENNQWSYNWETNKDGAKWTVIERNVPGGYVMTVEERNNCFVLTNTRITENDNTDKDVKDPPESGNNLPQTGDTLKLLPYSLLMSASGILLIILGVIRKRLNNEDQ